LIVSPVPVPESIEGIASIKEVQPIQVNDDEIARVSTSFRQHLMVNGVPNQIIANE